MVIADNCAQYANIIFNNADQYSGMTLFLGAVLFTFQIYGDFSGYTDMALGTARLFGFELLKNFNYPYFSRNVSEFWRRWHISLSTWFRDYIYIPLGGSKVSTLYKIRNTFIIFLVSGFWHGASWNFVFWGGLNALLIMPQVLFKTKKATTSIVAENTLLPSVKEFFQVLGTFILTTFVWIFFRAETLTKAFSYIGGIFKFNDLNPFAHQELGKGCAICFMLIIPFMLVEWVGRRNNYAIERFGLTWSKPLRWSFYALLIFVVGMYMNLGGSEFIYFQF